MLVDELEKLTGEGFRAGGEKMERLEQCNKELQRELDRVCDDLRRIRKTGIASLAARGGGLVDADGHFWENESQAKEFGELVLHVAKIKMMDLDVDSRGLARDFDTKTMGTGVNIEGGALVSEELRRVLIQKLGQYGKFRRNVTVVLMGMARSRFPKVETDLTVYCPGEGGEVTASDITFSDVELNPKTIFALALFAKELDDDSIIGLGEIIGVSVTRSMAKKEDEIGFVGDGTSTYFGMTGICQAIFNVDSTIGNIAGI